MDVLHVMGWMFSFPIAVFLAGTSVLILAWTIIVREYMSAKDVCSVIVTWTFIGGMAAVFLCMEGWLQ